jgi:tetratricopeptide (TPR) repeat protein
MSAQSQSPQSSDEPKVVSADGTPLPEPTLEERAQVFWMENKKTILLTCALVLLVLVAKEGVLYYIDQREKAIGAEFAAAGNDAAKLRSFTSAHADHQLAGLAWLALGDAAYKDGKFAEAVTAYDKAVPLTAGTAFGGRALIGKAFSQGLAGDKARLRRRSRLSSPMRSNRVPPDWKRVSISRCSRSRPAGSKKVAS